MGIESIFAAGWGCIFCKIGNGYISHRHCAFNDTLTHHRSCPAKSYHERLDLPKA
jgi:hypothetical protein